MRSSLGKQKCLAVLPLLLVLIVALSCGDEATVTPQPTAISTPQPTATPLPTATPTPTATAVPHTPTAVPPASTPNELAEPQSLSISGLYSSLGFTLNWEDSPDNEGGFHVERNGLEIARLPAGTITFKDVNLPDGRTFCYRVRASDEAGFSGYSNEACGTVVWPTLLSIEPAEATPGQCCIKVISQSGHLRIGRGYDESSRPFGLYFDGAAVGSINCYVTSCEGEFPVPIDASLDGHQVCARGGSCLTLEVVTTVAAPTLKDEDG